MTSILKGTNSHVADLFEDFIEKTKRGEKTYQTFLCVCGDEWDCKEFIKNVMEYIGPSCKRIKVKDLRKNYCNEPNPTVTKNCVIIQKYGRMKNAHEVVIGCSIKEIVGKDSVYSNGERFEHSNANLIFASTIDVASKLLIDSGIKRRAIVINV